MDWTLLALLAALLVTFLAWSRARRRAIEAGKAREAALRSRTFTLEPQETTGGRGFAVIAPDGSPLDPEALTWSEHRLESVPVAGLEHHEEARRSAAFAPGQPVELIVERGGPEQGAGAARAGAEPETPSPADESGKAPTTANEPAGVAGARTETGPRLRGAHGGEAPEVVGEPATIGVWDSTRRLQAGHVPAAAARRLLPRLEAGEVGESIVLWEQLGDDPSSGRVGLRLLLIHEDIDLES